MTPFARPSPSRSIREPILVRLATFCALAATAMAQEKLAATEEMLSLRERLAQAATAGNLAEARALKERLRSLSDRLGGDMPESAGASAGLEPTAVSGPQSAVAPGNCLGTPGTTYPPFLGGGGPIADLATQSFPLGVSGVAGPIWDLDLAMMLAHTWNADLDITLSSPAGTHCDVSSDNGGQFDDVFNGTLFDDQSAYSVTSFPYVNGLAVPDLRPEQSLNATFRGEDANGTWTLTIRDDAAADTGNLYAWALVLTEGAVHPEPSLTPPVSFTSSPNLVLPDLALVSDSIVVSGVGAILGDVNVYVEIQHTYNADLDVRLVAPNGTRVVLSENRGGSNDDVFNGTRFDSSSPNPIALYTFTNGVAAASLRPEGDLDELLCGDPNGTWTLEIEDQFGADVGMCTRWDLELAAIDMSPPSLPIRKGDLVATYCPSSALSGALDPTGFCVKLVHLPGLVQLDVDSNLPYFSNQGGTVPNVWNIDNLGPVYSIALDDRDTQQNTNIYVGASSVYGNHPMGPAGPGGVYRLDGTTGNISTFLTTGAFAVGADRIPIAAVPQGQDQPTIADIAFDRWHNQFFVSSFEDGRIYRVTENPITKVGVCVDVYDPWGKDNGAVGFVPRGERVWALHVVAGRFLLLSGWLRDIANPATPWPALWGNDPSTGQPPTQPNNAVFLLRLTQTGAIANMQPMLLKVMSPIMAAGTWDCQSHVGGWSSPVTDIEYGSPIFSRGAPIYCAERTMPGNVADPVDPGSADHKSRITSFLFPWMSATSSFRVGQALHCSDLRFEGANCDGGLCLNPSGKTLWTTGAALHVTFNDYIYGLQSIPRAGNASWTTPTDWSVLSDLDNDTSTFWDKTEPGDVECRRLGP